MQVIIETWRRGRGHDEKQLKISQVLRNDGNTTARHTITYSNGTSSLSAITSALDKRATWTPKKTAQGEPQRLHGKTRAFGFVEDIANAFQCFQRF